MYACMRPSWLCSFFMYKCNMCSFQLNSVCAMANFWLYLYFFLPLYSTLVCNGCRFTPYLTRCCVCTEHWGDNIISSIIVWHGYTYRWMVRIFAAVYPYNNLAPKYFLYATRCRSTHTTAESNGYWKRNGKQIYRRNKFCIARMKWVDSMRTGYKYQEEICLLSDGTLISAFRQFCEWAMEMFTNFVIRMINEQLKMANGKDRYW